MITILKYLEPTNCSRTILDSTKQTNEIFEIRIFWGSEFSSNTIDLRKPVTQMTSHFELLTQKFVN